MLSSCSDLDLVFGRSRSTSSPIRSLRGRSGACAPGALSDLSAVLASMRKKFSMGSSPLLPLLPYSLYLVLLYPLRLAEALGPHRQRYLDVLYGVPDAHRGDLSVDGVALLYRPLRVLGNEDAGLPVEGYEVARYLR